MYGDKGISFHVLALMFTAAIEMHYQMKLPYAMSDDMAAKLMAIIKVARMCHPTFVQDTYDDAHNYLRFAEEIQKEL